MRYFVGVDGGASRLDVLVADETGRRLGRGHSGPIYGGNGKDHINARIHMLDAVDEALVASNISGEQVAGIFLSCANWRSLRSAEASEWLSVLKIAPEAITVNDDGDLSALWAAANFPDPAIMVSLGTFWGSTGVADALEFSHLTDSLDVTQASADLGSGVTIGSLALGAAISAPFGGRPTQLTELLCTQLAVEDAEGLRTWARQYRSPADRAHLCSIAAQAAQAGDAVALLLFAQAGVGVAQATIPMAHYMKCADRPLTIALSGNVWRAGSCITTP
nr:hypothetical protein [Herpetosiphonaceae bacterium]